MNDTDIEKKYGVKTQHSNTEESGLFFIRYIFCNSIRRSINAYFFHGQIVKTVRRNNPYSSSILE